MTLVYSSNVSQSFRVVKNKVDIYLLDYSKFFHQVENFKNLLSADELSRAQRYQSWSLQDQFIVQHGLTRHLLAYHLRTSPEEIDIVTRKFGKPHVKGLYFNISHSGDYLAVAISKDVPVGIDIESTTRNIDLNHIAAIVLSDAERFNLFSLPKPQQKTTLLRTWVCKEAYWKYVGKGLNSLIKQLEVMPTAERDIFTIEGRSGHHHNHSIQSFEAPDQELLGSIAYKGVKAEVNLRVNELPVLI